MGLLEWGRQVVLLSTTTTTTISNQKNADCHNFIKIEITHLGYQ